jgi:hypothetical protein
MSQQPPYGGPEYPQYPQGQNPQNPQNPQQPPYGQQPGYQPYGQQYPPNPYGPGGPQQKSHTTRNVLIIVTVLVVLFCGGATTFVIWAFSSIGDSIDTSFNDEYEGSENDPIAVEQGEAFSIRGFDYDEGWSIGPEPGLDGYVNLTGLSVTNDSHDGAETVFLVFEFLDGQETLGDLRCTSNATVRSDRTVKMSCNASEIPGSYDSIEVYDDATFE